MKRVPKRGYHPVTSYGIVLFAFFRSETQNEPSCHFLLYQRRDTYEYIEFVKGMWETKAQALRFFSLMSEEERRRLQEHSFDDLWNDFWIRRASAANVDMINRAKAKYERIRPFIEEMIASTTALGPAAPWGFPKGRKNVGESGTACALREFEEETRMPRSSVTLVPETHPIEEHYRGSDGRQYSTVYYMAQYFPENLTRGGTTELKAAQCATPPLLATPHGIRKHTASNEAYRVRWFPLSEALKLLDPYRQEVLAQVKRIIENKGILLSKETRIE